MTIGASQRQASRRVPVEFYILAETHNDGAVIGSLTDRPIHEAVLDRDGKRYRFAGVALRDSTGRFRVETLNRGEWIVEPGLIYVAE